MPFRGRKPPDAPGNESCPKGGKHDSAWLDWHYVNKVVHHREKVCWKCGDPVSIQSEAHRKDAHDYCSRCRTVIP